MTTLDKATHDAVKATKKEYHAKESHKRQLARTSARKRANLAVIAAKSADRRSHDRAKRRASIDTIKARTESAAQVASARGANASQLLAQREAARTQRAINPPRPSIGNRAQERIVSGATNKTIDTATPSSDSGLIMTVVFTIVGLALFYQVVTKAGQFSDLVNRTGDFLHKISSTAPLFQVVAK